MDIRLASPFFSTTLWVDGADDFEALAEAQIRLPLYLKARLGDEFELFRHEPGDIDLDRFWDAA